MVLIGNMLRIPVTFRVPATDDGTLTDPTVVTVIVELPTGTQLTSVYGGATAAGTIVKSATGSYYLDYTPATAGTYRWRWTGTGAATAAAEGAFTIEASSL